MYSKGAGELRPVVRTQSTQLWRPALNVSVHTHAAFVQLRAWHDTKRNEVALVIVHCDMAKDSNFKFMCLHSGLSWYHRRPDCTDIDLNDAVSQALFLTD